MMEPIEGWNFVFYLGNLLADAAIAAFAIKSGYFDKKYNTLKDTRKKEMAKLDDICEVVGDVYLKVGDIMDGGRSVDENYFLGNLDDLKPLYQLLGSIGKENAKKVRTALIDEFSKEHAEKLNEDDTAENVMRPFIKIKLVIKLFNHTLEDTLNRIDESIKSVDEDLQNLDKLTKYLSDINIICLFIFGIAFQVTSLFASGWITFFPFPFRIFIFAFCPAIIVLAILRLLAEIGWI